MAVSKEFYSKNKLITEFWKIIKYRKQLENHKFFHDEEKLKLKSRKNLRKNKENSE